MAGSTLNYDLGNCDACKIVIASELTGCPITLIKVETGAKLVNYLTSSSLPVFNLSSGEQLFSSNAACRYVWNIGRKCVDEAIDDVWLEWETTHLKPSVDSLVKSGGKSGVTKLGDFGNILQCLDAHLRSIGKQVTLSQIAIWCTLYPVFSSGSLSKEIAEKFSATSAWFSRLAAHKAFSVAVQKIGLSELSVKHLGPAAASPTEDIGGLSDVDRLFVESKWSRRTLRPAPLLPQEGERNVLITSALPYVNNVPHLGNIIGCVLSADVYARFCRLRGYNVLYICGTDEYGTATETKAIEEGLTPQQICDKYHQLHANIYKWFNIAFDHFGRTTTQHQTKIAQDIFWELHRNNYICQDSIDQLFCENCSRFLADRFVEGVCPLCSADDARGDQCDKCGKLINAVDLKMPQCKLCRHTPVIKTSRHLFLDLPKLVDKLSNHLEKVYSEGLWTNNAKVITESWLKSGLKPRCISRDLKWGTPVPLEGFTDKVFYVWFDAPIGYISITANYTDQWEKWWKNPSQVQLYNFMAKDNVPFHSVIFPASLLGTGQPWTVVGNMSATEYLNYEDGKFSKSRGLGVFGDNAMDAGLDADIFRFYLLYLRPEAQDTSFSWDDFMMKNNSELLSNLGNFINRALMFVANKLDGKLSRIEFSSQERDLVIGVSNELRNYVNSLERIRFRDGIRHILNISALGNGYIQANKPWDLLKGSEHDKLKAGTVASLSCNISYLLAVMLLPYMPSVAQTILTQLNASTEEHVVDNEFQFILQDNFVQFLPEGHQIGKPEPLFKKIEPAQIQQFKERFGGQQKKTPSQTPVSSEELKQQIEKQGEVVRKLKADKSEKAKVDAEVAILLALKKQLAIVDGTPTAPEAKPKQTSGKARKGQKTH